MRRTLVLEVAAAVAMLLFGLWVSQGLQTLPLEKTPEAQPLKVITVTMPKPLFVSAPWECSLPNIEDPITFPPAQFTAPATTALISAGLPVVSSHRPAVGKLSFLTDGDASSDNSNEVEFAASPVWIRLDLQRPVLVDEIWIWHGQGTHDRRLTPEVFMGMVVQVASDPGFTEGVATLFNSDYNNTLGLGKGPDPTYQETNRGRGISAGGRLARYVRVWGGGAYSGGPNRFVEIQVWGRPAS